MTDEQVYQSFSQAQIEKLQESPLMGVEEPSSKVPRGTKIGKQGTTGQDDMLIPPRVLPAIPNTLGLTNPARRILKAQTVRVHQVS